MPGAAWIRLSLHATQDGQDVSNPGVPGQVVQHNDTKADGNKEHSAKEVSHGLSHHNPPFQARVGIATTIRKNDTSTLPEFDLAPNRWSGRGHCRMNDERTDLEVFQQCRGPGSW